MPEVSGPVKSWLPTGQMLNSLATMFMDILFPQNPKNHASPDFRTLKILALGAKTFEDTKIGIYRFPCWLNYLPLRRERSSITAPRCRAKPGYEHFEWNHKGVFSQESCPADVTFISSTTHIVNQMPTVSAPMQNLCSVLF